MFITFMRRTLLMAAVSAVFVSGSLATTYGDVVTRAEAAPCSLLPPTVISVPVYPYFASTLPWVEARSTDPVGPFPLSALVPFPWASIEGIWTMKLPDGTSLQFSFDVQVDCNGRKFLRVLGFDQKTFRVTSEGVGIGMNNDMLVRAAMTSSASQYMVYIRQFKVPQGKAVPGKISTVVTIRPFDADSSADVHMIARKASPLTLPKYVQQQREIEEKRQAERRRPTSARP